jgi:hypothetical protein
MVSELVMPDTIPGRGRWRSGLVKDRCLETKVPLLSLKKTAGCKFRDSDVDIFVDSCGGGGLLGRSTGDSDLEPYSADARS